MLILCHRALKLYVLPISGADANPNSAQTPAVFPLAAQACSTEHWLHRFPIMRFCQIFLERAIWLRDDELVAVGSTSSETVRTSPVVILSRVKCRFQPCETIKVIRISSHQLMFRSKHATASLWTMISWSGSTLRFKNSMFFFNPALG